MGLLNGKVAIITGAGGGLGRAHALLLASEGARIVVNDLGGTMDGSGSGAAMADQVVAEIEAAGGEAIANYASVSDETGAQSMVDDAIRTWGRLDILVNNAGIQTPGSTMEMQPRHFDLSYRVNVRGPYVFSRTVIPHMLNAGAGHIINISSGAAIGPGEGPYEGRPAAGGGGTTYGVSKAALERFTQGLASELFQQNISVNALSPEHPEWTEGGHYFRAVVAGGEPAYTGWRLSGEIIGDAAATICGKQPKSFTGRIVVDGQVMVEDGMTEAEVLARYPVQG